ncbi:ABC transporter permease subunit [Halorubraceae archaeon YAN]|nr:ABC transporter permease subunit [Halorubraceae archaeon YAN]
MFETVQYEVQRRQRGTIALTVGIAAVAAFFVALFPSFSGSGIDIDQMLEAWPPALQEAFGIETLATIEGFLAVELYNFVWVIVLGLYFAYSAASVIADDIERDRMDLLLSLPVSRSQLLFEKVGSLLAPIVLINLGVAVAVYASILAIGESIALSRLVMVHLLSVPYLLACAAIGLILSVTVTRADVGKRLALAVIFVLYLLDSIAATVDGLGFIRYLSPTYYYNPTEILVHGTYGIGDAAILLVITIVLLGIARSIFVRRDI